MKRPEPNVAYYQVEAGAERVSGVVEAEGGSVIIAVAVYNSSPKEIFDYIWGFCDSERMRVRLGEMLEIGAKSKRNVIILLQQTPTPTRLILSS